ncbi:MAG: cation-transporting P-type ATPase, partial [Acidimicrobiales bacterium]
MPERGLSSAEALARLDRCGPNRVPEPARRPLASRVVEQIRDPMLVLLLGAAALTAVLHDASNTVIIGVVVVFNTT